MYGCVLNEIYYQENRWNHSKQIIFKIQQNALKMPGRQHLAIGGDLRPLTNTNRLQSAGEDSYITARDSALFPCCKLVWFGYPHPERFFYRLGQSYDCPSASEWPWGICVNNSHETAANSLQNHNKTRMSNAVIIYSNNTLHIVLIK